MDHCGHCTAAESGGKLNEYFGIEGMDSVGQLTGRLYVFARALGRTRERAGTVDLDVVVYPVCAGYYQADAAGSACNIIIDRGRQICAVFVVGACGPHRGHVVAVFDACFADGKRCE